MDKQMRKSSEDESSSTEDLENVLSPTGQSLEGERAKTEASGSIGRDTTGQAHRGRKSENDVEREREESPGISNRDLESEDWEDPSLAEGADIEDEEDV